jgi:hypothetical protein
MTTTRKSSTSGVVIGRRVRLKHVPDETLWGQMIDRRGLLGRWCHMECGIYKKGVLRK